MSVFAFSAGALLLSMCIILFRLFAGPSLYDRVLGVNSFGTATVLFIGAIGFMNERPEFLDIALLYALINFVGTIAILKFFRYRSLGDVPQITRKDSSFKDEVG